jgi:hypothetical protein
MDEAVAERIACSLSLLRRQTIAELMQEPAHAIDGNEQVEGDDKRAEGLDEEGLHQLMILEVKAIGDARKDSLAQRRQKTRAY